MEYALHPQLPFFHRLAALFLRLQASVVQLASSRIRAKENGASARAARLLDAHGDAILRLAYSYLHNMSDAEDILQDTLMRYLRKQPVFENAAHEKAWLLRVAINLSKNRISYNRYRAHDELDDHFLSDEAPELAFVWDAVRQLPQPSAEVVHLFYQEGYSCAEIAALLGKNEATVRSLLSRARQKLKSVLKEDYDFEI